MKSLVACGFERYPVRHACHEVATFGKQLELGLGRSLVHFRLPTEGTERHLVIEVAWLFRFVEHGKDAAVELLVVHVVLPRHAFVEEPLLRNLFVWMLRDAPVELPSRVGPQFVVAPVERVLQGKAAMSLSALQLQLLSLHEIAVLIQQFGIEHSADSAWRASVTPADVCLVVNGVAKEIASIIHVDIDLFLRNRLAKPVETVGPSVERRRRFCLLTKGEGNCRNKECE